MNPEPEPSGDHQVPNEPDSPAPGHSDGLEETARPDYEPPPEVPNRNRPANPSAPTEPIPSGQAHPLPERPQVPAPVAEVAPWQQPPPTSGLAVTALVMGCLSVLCLSCGPYSIITLPLFIATVIISHIARANLYKQNPPMSGQGLALAGLIMGYISLGLCVLMFVVIAAFFGLGLFLNWASISSP